MKQGELFSAGRYRDKKSSRQDLGDATELMKKVAAKVPQRRKILKDFSPEEAKEIFEEIKSDKESKKIPDESDTSKQMRELVYRTKMIVKKMEIGNKSKVILFPSYSRDSTEVSWYKMADFSAQYYMYRMADRMGRQAKPRRDTDRFGRMHVITSICGIEKFAAQAMELGVFDRHEETLDGIHIFYLKRGLTDDEVTILRRTEEMQREMMHTVIRPKKASPEVYLDILALARQIVRMNEGIGRVYRIEIGDKIAENALGILNLYFDYIGGFIDTESVKGEMQKMLNRVRAGMALLGDAEVVKTVKVCTIGDSIVKIEDKISKLK